MSSTRVQRKVQPRKRSSSRGKRRRTSWLRRYRGLLAALLVAVSGYLVYFDVAVTSRFDGRLWALPSRIYSADLRIEPGLQLPATAIEKRLERCGYARTAGTPRQPGQYARSGERLLIYLRAFSTPGTTAGARRIELRFRDDRIVTLRDYQGRDLDTAQLEPEPLATLYGERHEERDPLSLEKVPPRFVQAVLAAEDARFHSHYGLDLRGILRAGWTNLRAGRIVQGGSTITQQTVKNLFLSQRRSWWRKFREGVMALILELHYSKSRILEVYLNDVYLGQRGAVAICGAQAAARFYFGRDLADLTLSEWALLAGTIRSPGRYNPFVHGERARTRRDQVLEAMEQLGLAGGEEVRRARAEELRLASGKGGFSGAAYVVDFVRAQLARDYPRRVLREEGLEIHTTLDTSVQEAAEQVLREGLTRLEREVPTVRRQVAQRSLQGAVLVTRPSSGAILAMVGGRDYRETQFNRVVQALRQPGSCFKPFVYAAGFEISRETPRRGLTPATLLDDSPLELLAGGKPWRPANYDQRYRGQVTARQALEQSLNVPTVRAAQRIGLEQVIETARRCGIRSPLAEVPSLALGTGEVTPLELAEAYGTFAHGGRRVSPWIVRAVTDRHGAARRGREPQPRAALAPESAYLIHDLLEGVVERGTARSVARLGFHDRAAGKTGTTDDTRDSWFVGYSGDVLGLVWVGYDDNARTGLTGSRGALPIWVELMKRVGDGRERRSGPSRRTPPPGIVRVRIDPQSGRLAGPRCPTAFAESFIEGSEPRGACPLHGGRLRRWWQRLRGRSEHRDRRGV